MLLDIYDMNSVERLTQMLKNSISVYTSFVSFVVSFQYIKSSKYIEIFWMMSSMDLYYNISVLEPLWYKLRRKMNINALTVLLSLVYLSFVSFVASFHHVKSPKLQRYCEWCPLVIYIILVLLSSLYNMNGIERLTQMY
jgi:hypothetical protein